MMKPRTGRPVVAVSRALSASAVLGGALAAVAGSSPWTVGISAIAFAVFGGLLALLGVILGELREDVRTEDQPD